MPALSFQEMILLDKHRGIVLYRAVDANGRAFFHYILASRESIKQMRHDHDAGKEQVDYTSYGDIVYSGWGEPTNEEQAMVKKKWAAQ